MRKKQLRADEVIQLVAHNTAQENVVLDPANGLPINLGYQLKLRIRREAPVKELIAALKRTESSHVRQVVCDILGERHARSAVPALILCLDDASSGVRSSAADALAKIAHPSAGEALYWHFQRDEDEGVRRMLAAALGAVQYRPAIPELIAALDEPDDIMRGTAAWSLGVLHAHEAVEALRQTLLKESQRYPIERISVALNIIGLKCAT